MNNNNLSNNETLLLNFLISMYNDNIRLIENLTISNNEIRTTIIETFNMLRYNRINTRNTTNSTTNTTNTRNTRSRTRSNMNLTNNPYTIDYIQEFTIPLNYTLPNQESTNTNDTTRNNRLNQIHNLFQSFFDRVDVFPTQEQIENAIRTVRFNDIVRPNNTSCPISLDIFNENDQVSIIRHCGHIFNPQSLNTWFRSNCICPVCRYDIREYNSNT
jgi:hypothetical protein